MRDLEALSNEDDRSSYVHRIPIADSSSIRSGVSVAARLR